MRWLLRPRRWGKELLRNPSILGALIGCFLTVATHQYLLSSKTSLTPGWQRRIHAANLAANLEIVSKTICGASNPTANFTRNLQELHSQTGANYPTLPVRKMLLAVVATPGCDLKDSALKVDTSWGQDFEDWQLVVGTNGLSFAELQIGESSHTLLAPQCQDFSVGGGYLGPTQLFCLLMAVHNSHHSGYRWFIFGHHASANSSLYISVLRLERLLSRLDPAAVVYMGGSGDTSVPHCLGEAGIVLSQRALELIVPHLPSCLQEAAIVGGGTNFVGGAKALGVCFEAKLQVTCRRLNKRFLSNFQGISAVRPKWAESHQDFVTVFPVSSPEDLQLLYLTDLMRELRHLRWEIQRDSQALYKSPLCNLETEKVDLAPPPPLQASEVKGWSVANSWSAYVSNQLNPRAPYGGKLKLDLEMMAKRGLEILNKKNSTNFKFKRVVYAYYRYRATNGREIILDVETSSKAVLRLHILRPLLFNRPVLLEDSGPEAIDKTIDFVVPISNVQGRFAEFMKTYEDVCLKFRENCRLNLVVYGSQDLQMICSNLSLYSARYPHAQFNLIPGEGKFSRGRARHTGMQTLPKSALVFTCDVDMTIDRSFLDRCRRNTIEGRRVYFPEVFKYYDMNYVYRFEPRPLSGRYNISRKHGHWCTYGYGMLCIYKSDYDLIGGFNSTIEGWGGEDIQLIDAVLAHGLEVMRAPEPALFHRYHPKVCSELSGERYEVCVKSRNEDIADKQQLAHHINHLQHKCNFTLVDPSMHTDPELAKAQDLDPDLE